MMKKLSALGVSLLLFLCTEIQAKDYTTYY